MFTGTGYAVCRVLTGAFETVTFLVPTNPLMKPASPMLVLEAWGPPSPHSFFRLAKRPADTPRQQKRFWHTQGRTDDSFYEDRFECSSETVANGMFNLCMEKRGWKRSRAEW